MKRLFDESGLGTLKLKNRFFRSATWESLAEDSGHINDRILSIYEDLARGGVAAIITGYAFVLKEEQPNPRMFGIYDDSFIASYKPLIERVHKHGSNIILQLVYGGSFTWHDPEKRTIWGPSAVFNKISGITPVEMTVENIKTLVAAFGQAASRAMKSGFDGVQIHAGHGYLLNQFLSPYFNVREDRYGGSSENRARIIHEIFDSIKQHTAADFPVLIKLNCSDFNGSKGFTFDECKTLCKALSDKNITAVEISGGPVFRPPKPEKDPTKPVELTSRESYFSAYAKDIAQSIGAPVILVGGNRTVAVMESLLNETSIAYFSMSRPLLSEPDLINTWEKDPTAKPRCTSCTQCFTPQGNICVMNRS